MPSMASRSFSRSSVSGDRTSTAASLVVPSSLVLKARMATRSPGRSDSTKTPAARRMRPTSARVEPEVSSRSATSNGASVVAKLAIFCGRPSSKSVKLSARRPATGLPRASVTTAGTETSCVSMRTTSSSSTTSPPPGFFCGVEEGRSPFAAPPSGVGAGATRRGRCSCCCATRASSLPEYSTRAYTLRRKFTVKYSRKRARTERGGRQVMPVIGRLDGQVDEVLIAPLDKRRREEAEPPRADDVQTRGDAKENRGGHGERAARGEVGKDAVRDELPVWALLK